MRRLILAVLASVSLAPGLKAQADTESGHSLIYTKNISKENFIRALRNCDRATLRASCVEIANAARRIVPNSIPENTPWSLTNLTDYLETLEERECPAGGLGNFADWAPDPRGRGRINFDRARPCEEGERLLFDGDKAVVSLRYGNLIRDYAVAQAGAPRALQVPPAVVDTPPKTRSEIVIPRPGKEETPAIVRFVPKPDTVTQILRMTDTVHVYTHERELVTVRKGPRVWPWIIGGALLGGGIGAYCHFEGCGGHDIHIENTLNNGFRAAGIRVGIP